VCRIVEHPETGVKTLQFVLIQRKDNHQWALPGGIVEAGQRISDTRTREFAEEALNSTKGEHESDEAYSLRIEALRVELNKIFDKSHLDSDDILFSGIVDDERNTDKAWMETCAILTVLSGDMAEIRLEAGDDAGKVKWKSYRPNLELYASHSFFISLAIKKLVQRGIVNANGEVL
jgi:ADP-ribose pyrophosphatase YjhB (NUDIX family)